MIRLEIIDIYDIHSEMVEPVVFTTSPKFSSVKFESTASDITYRWNGKKQFQKILYRYDESAAFQELGGDQILFRRSGLEPNTEYLLQIYAEITGNTRTNLVTVVTQTSPILDSITASLVEGSKSSAATLMWSKGEGAHFETIAIAADPPIPLIEKVTTKGTEFRIESSNGSIELTGLYAATDYNITIQGLVEKMARKILNF